MTRAFSLLIFILLSACPLFLLAEDADPELARIHSEVEYQTKKLEELEQRQDKIKKEIGSKENQLAKLRKEEKSIKLVLEKVKKQKKAVEAEVTTIKKSIERLLIKSKHLIKAMYKFQVGGAAGKLLRVKTQNQILVGFTYFTSLNTTYKSLIDELTHNRSELKSKTLELDEKRKEQESLSKNVLEKKESIKKELSLKKDLESSLEQEKESLTYTLTALKAEAERLEKLVFAITTDSHTTSMTWGEPVAPVVPEQEQVEQEELTDFQGAEQVSSIKQEVPKEAKDEIKPKEKFKGIGLFRQKGSLRKPVKGELLSRFGKQKHNTFEDFVFYKGLEFRTKDNAEVKAIADAQVIFVGRMPGYGTIVILDHGERFYSLYGRLGETSVTKNLIVYKGQQIATTGPANQGGRSFYFEIRRNGAPVNPQDYFGGKL